MRRGWVRRLLEYAKRQKLLRAAFRIVNRVTKGPFTFSPELQAIMQARTIGGELDVTELEYIWDAAVIARRALCCGSGREVEQSRSILAAAGVERFVAYGSCGSPETQ
jgi:hypothetical protein